MKSEVAVRHSVFGNYITGDTTKIPTADLEKLRADTVLYNTLWARYLDSTKGKWGVSSIPTEKGFTEWLQRQAKSNKEEK